MAGIFTLTNLDLLVALAISIAVGAISWRNRPRPGAYALTGFMLVVAIWELAHLLAHATQATLLFRRLRWLGIGSAAFVWFVFVLAYVGRDDLITRKTLALLLLWPLTLNALIWLPEVAAPVGVDVGAGVWDGLYEGTSGLFWTHVGLSYGLFVIGSVLLLVFVRRSHPVFRRQGLAVLAGVGALWVGSVVTVFELFGDVHVHFLPGGLTVMGVAFLWATTRGRLTDLMPVAASAVLQTMGTGVLVTDETGRVVEINPQARSLFGLAGSAGVVGDSIEDVLSASRAEPSDRRAFDVGADATSADPPSAAPASTSATPSRSPSASDSTSEPHPQSESESASASTSTSTAEPIELGDRLVEVTASPLRTGRGRVAGHVFVLNDVTEERRRQAELRRQKDRLDRFASIISHDLRNPLNVASGRLTLARETCDSEHLDSIDDALARIETITDETLALARAGQTVDPETIEPTALRDLVEASWGAVVTDHAELRVDLDRDVEIEADRDRLRQVFENVFRNAIQHGDGSVAVRVGALDDDRGLFVEDDGPGVPAGERTRVFEPGYSSDETGTGLGLNIVKEIVEAHGWEVRIADGTDGGTRIEFRGVDVLDRAA